MDKRRLKQELKFEMIKEMLDNRKNAFGETKQELFLDNIGIKNPTRAESRRLKKLVESMYQSEYEKWVKLQ